MTDRLDGYRGLPEDRSTEIVDDISIPWPAGKPVKDWESNDDPDRIKRIKQLEKDNGDSLY